MLLNLAVLGIAKVIARCGSLWFEIYEFMKWFISCSQM